MLTRVWPQARWKVGEMFGVVGEKQLGLTIVLGKRQMRVGLEVLRLRLFPPRHAGWHISRQRIKK